MLRSYFRITIVSLYTYTSSCLPTDQKFPLKNSLSGCEALKEVGIPFLHANFGSFFVYRMQMKHIVEPLFVSHCILVQYCFLSFVSIILRHLCPVHQVRTLISKFRSEVFFCQPFRLGGPWTFDIRFHVCGDPGPISSRSLDSARSQRELVSVSRLCSSPTRCTLCISASLAFKKSSSFSKKSRRTCSVSSLWSLRAVPFTFINLMFSRLEYALR